MLAKDCPGINKKGGDGSPDGRAMDGAKGSEISTVDSTFKETLQIRRAESYNCGDNITNENAKLFHKSSTITTFFDTIQLTI